MNFPMNFLDWLGWAGAVDLSKMQSGQHKVHVDNLNVRKLIVELFSNSSYIEKVIQVIASDRHTKAIQVIVKSLLM